MPFDKGIPHVKNYYTITSSQAFKTTLFNNIFLDYKSSHVVIIFQHFRNCLFSIISEWLKVKR